MAARVLVGLEVCGVGHLELIGFDRFGFGNGSFKQPGEDPALRPPEVETIDAVPFSKALRQLVPDRAGDENPPDAVQSFSKIGRLPPFL